MENRLAVDHFEETPMEFHGDAEALNDQVSPARTSLCCEDLCLIPVEMARQR